MDKQAQPFINFHSCYQIQNKGYSLFLCKSYRTEQWCESRLAARCCRIAAGVLQAHLCGHGLSHQPQRLYLLKTRHHLPQLHRAARLPGQVELQRPFGEQHDHGGAQQKAAHLVALAQLNALIFIAPLG